MRGRVRIVSRNREFAQALARLLASSTYVKIKERVRRDGSVVVTLKPL